MAHFSPIHGGIGSGAWATGYVVQPLDLQTIDGRLTSCLHEGGGTWAPAAVIEVGGAGFKVTGPALVSLSPIFTVAGQSLFSGGIVCANIVQFSGAPTSFDSTSPVDFSGAVSLLGTLTVGASGIIVHAASSGETYAAAASVYHQSGSFDTYDAGSSLRLNGDIDGTTGHFISGYVGQIDVGANLKVAGLLTVESGGSLEVKASGALTADASSTVSINGALALGGSTAAQLQRPLTKSGAGQIRENLNIIATPNANQAFSITDGSVFVVAGGTLSGNYDYTMTATSVGAGVCVRWYNGAIDEIHLKQPDGVTAIATITQAAISGQFFWVDICWSGSSWIVVGGQKVP